MRLMKRDLAVACKCGSGDMARSEPEPVPGLRARRGAWREKAGLDPCRSFDLAALKTPLIFRSHRKYWRTPGLRRAWRRTSRSTARWRMDRTLVMSPVSGRILLDPDGDRHAERRHSVESVAPDFCLCPLIRQIPGVESPADNGLVAKHGGLDQASSVVA
jgi:hypothetical protein